MPWRVLDVWTRSHETFVLPVRDQFRPCSQGSRGILYPGKESKRVIGQRETKTSSLGGKLGLQFRWQVEYKSHWLLSGEVSCWNSCILIHFYGKIRSVFCKISL
jgi:hypothetical protein